MVLMPSKTKYKKKQKGQRRGLAKKAFFIEFGDFGMQALDRNRISAQQIEACRVAISRVLGKKGKVWIRIFPDKPFTKKPQETRMGKGKGSIEKWEAVVRPGQILFELIGISEQEAKKAFALADAKLGIKTRFVQRVERV